MKPIEYEGNDQHMHYSYNRMREGPNYFTVHYKNSSVLRQDPKDAWRMLGAAKFTDNGKKLKEWCLEMHDKYVVQKEAKAAITEEGRKDTSFASEAMEEESADPTANTKMVT